MSIFEYNGAALIGMGGKGCVGIAVDRRLGVNQFRTVTTNYRKAFQLTSRAFIAMGGLATDIQTFVELLRFRVKLYSLREEREMSVEVLANMVGAMLYEKRFGPYFVETMVAGLTSKGESYICGYDSIGAPCVYPDFCVAGTAADPLLGACEYFYQPDMDKDTLLETVSQCILAGVDRDCVSGWGADVYLLTSDGKLCSRTLKGRQD